MKKLDLAASLTAALMAVSLFSCNDKKPAAEKEKSKPAPAAVSEENVEYQNGNYISDSFKMYADPNIWQYDSSASVTTGGSMPCFLKMITDREFTTCGLNVYVSENKDGKSAQEAIDAENSKDIVFTGTTATAKYTFYYCEWAANDNLHCRSYLADLGEKYLCVYAESSNFGYVEGKIAEVLSSIKTK